ncbi:retrotransposon hot spot (RHS) protein, putative [Trypanosoma cruzi]|uniref:Retrotransposon hot spot (RHS) protein, putative n=1 Tax=Trypanosoma cruzi (strain CL Brener) TaxID=353153 RepID=Q4CRR5_TRYCC|nr:retrotransposon hot spot (RHS) protein, putative [Trypanosoma cruzi]EAN82967.1 retrotransposon hot spot (RHS) protein, putative [Trypanosoma cruzi]|eukprot:XP_804818.1 retrotransposon hot spot (RHS) protein [Trypanosoma cruzi strain CL Brener]
MSGGPESVQGGNVESQSSNLSQGVRRRTRSEFEGETDYSSATRRRLEEIHRPQWTMSSSVEDILLEGSTNRTDMKLNEFLRSKLGGTAAVGEDYNVTMEAFVQEPDAYVKDQQLLEEILNLTAYQTLKILLEAINKLHHEGVFFLDQWRDYEGKDTVTPVARRKLNRVLTQVLTEKRREAEERARRDEQQIMFNLTLSIEDVLFQGRVRVMEIKLNDFLTMKFDGRGILRANRNVLLRDFFGDPTRYIRDAGVLNEIQASYAYAEMEGAVRDEMGLKEDVRRLHHENGVLSLEQWRDYEGKDTVTQLAREKLNRVLTQVLTEERREAEERARRDEQQIMFNLALSIEDVLFQGRVRVMEIKLNDFLTMKFDGRGILRANRNVLLRDFFGDPTRYIRDAGVLNEIQASYAYAEMEGAVRDEMDLKEVVRRLHHEGVYSLEQWRDYEGKDTVTQLAREKLNRVLTQVLTEERREAEERARRDEQQIMFNLALSIEDVLFQGRVRVMEIKLNDFLTMKFDGRGVVDTNRSVLLKEFFRDPTSYIRDAGVLNEIQASYAYAEMEGAVRDEMGLKEDVRRLHHENGVLSLEQWRDYEGKDTVTQLAREKLNRVLTQVLTEERREAEERARRDEQQIMFNLALSIEDVLFQGRVRVMEIKLNDFLTMEFDGRGVVDTNRSVLLKEFFRDPTSYIRDAGVLNEIQASYAYAEMEGAVRDEMGLKEDVRRLHHENGVLSLEQWRDYEGKDTVTPLAKGKLNRVLTQVLTEERREAEERARRDQQQIMFNLTLSIEDVLFQGRARVMEIKLNDFLTMKFDGRGVVDTNRSVLLKEFFRDPTRYIRDAGVLNEIQASDAYLRAVKAVREEMDMEEDLTKLHYNHLSTLFGWSLATAEIRASVHEITKSFLDPALEEARKPTTTIAPIKMEGLYESVYNASWHHVVEVPGGEGTQTGIGMYVREGKPPQSWTYTAVGNTLEKDDSLEQSGAARPRLMVLTSDDGWPYTMNGPHRAGIDLCVNCEVERVWQIVKRGLSKWFNNFHLTLNPSPVPHLLVGTPGIGKSMNAGSYLLYQLLHYDIKKLQVVVHCFGDTAYVFDKTIQTVTKYMGNKTSKSVLGGLWQRGMKGYIIYDVAKKGTPPDTDIAPCKGWGMIVVSSPNLDNFSEWEKQSESVQIVMNCPEKDDVKAMCVWMKHNRQLPEEEADYWKKVEVRMDNLGPLLRYVFDQSKYKSRLDSCESIVDEMTLPDTNYYSVLGTGKMCDGSHVSHKLVKVVRVRGNGHSELPLNALISSHLAELTLCKLAELMVPNDFNLLILAIKDDLISKALEDHSLFAFLSAAFVNAIIPKLTELKVEKNAPPHRCALRVYPHERPLKPCLLECLENLKKKINIECRVLYKPEAKNFPLVDGFFFVDSPRKTLVGLQMMTAGGHHTTASTVRQFNERMAEYFNGWKKFSQDMLWDIIYIQHADSTPMNDWQRCGPVNNNNLSDDEKKIVAFWREKVHQYQVSVSSGDF